jgi:hypothetical protein
MQRLRADSSTVETSWAFAGFLDMSKNAVLLRARVFAGLIALCGCEPKTHAIEHSASASDGDATDAAGDSEASGEPASYPNCLWDLVSDPPPGEGNACPTGGGYGGGEGEGFCTFCLCHEPCGRDDDCAPPPGITAQGDCNADGACFLRCGGGKTCPEGMTCSQQSYDDDGDICVWGTHDAFFCAEVLGGPPDLCGEINDESVCNATVSELTSDRCLWVEESILATGAATCEATGKQGHCVWMQAAGTCSGTDTCASGDERVRWRDLGAGTVAVASFECGFQPHESEGYETCDFSGATAIPLICACGCSSD